jgi:multiple sugar transport system ATP-binding protein
MVRRPRVFLFDEPLSNLDATMRLEMRAELARLHRRLAATMVFVTHDQDEALTLGDRIAVMKQGVIQQVGTPMELYQRPANLFVAGFIGSPPMNFFRGAVAPKANALFFQEQAGAGAESPPPFALRLDDAHTARMRAYSERPVILGLRPEDILDRQSAPQASSDQTVEALADLVQPMGSETLVHLRSGAHSYVVRFPATGPVRLAQELTVVFEMSRAHFFDPATERVLV